MPNAPGRALLIRTMFPIVPRVNLARVRTDRNQDRGERAGLAATMLPSHRRHRQEVRIAGGDTLLLCASHPGPPRTEAPELDPRIGHADRPVQERGSLR